MLLLYLSIISNGLNLYAVARVLIFSFPPAGLLVSGGLS